MVSEKLCAGARCVDCDCAISERSRKTCRRTEGGKRQRQECVVAVFCFKVNNRREETWGEKNNRRKYENIMEG